MMIPKPIIIFYNPMILSLRERVQAQEGIIFMMVAMDCLYMQDF